MGIYIPSSTNAKEALCGALHGALTELQNSHPDGWFIVTGDSSHAHPKSVSQFLIYSSFTLFLYLSELNCSHNSISLWTFWREGKMSCIMFAQTIPSAYPAAPLPHFGYSDHTSVMLMLAYRPLML